MTSIGMKASVVAMGLQLLLAEASDAQTPEQSCQAALARAAGAYARCQAAVVSWFHIRGQTPGVDFKQVGTPKMTRCRTAYVAKWNVLHGRSDLATSTCGGPRFVDNGDGTVIDHLTNLIWERKQNRDDVENLTDPHDADNSYTWSASGTVADGTIFTEFLPALNAGLLGGSADWRLPTRDELQTLLAEPYTGNDCVQLGCADPTLGPSTKHLWSSTVIPETPSFAWYVEFQSGHINRYCTLIDLDDDDDAGVYSARAVRAGGP